MKEDLLHYVWRHKQFDVANLQTTTGETIEIHDAGLPNANAGPDFLNAKIRIGETLWAGNVEMHLHASEWMTHKHHDDPAYNNVILHVVLTEDAPVFRAGGERIPCLELRGRISAKLSKTYLKLIHNAHWIPCEHHFFRVPEITRNLWLDRLLVERIEQKTGDIECRLEQNKGSWEDTFYQFLAKNFGVKINAEPFDALARSLPLTILSKHKSCLFQIEALLFGQSGLLEGDFEDEYPRKLQKEYAFLRKKYGLTPIVRGQWKFMRLRPPNFPTIRLAQFATLIVQSVHLFSKILEVEKVADIEKLFDVTLSDYWLTHYVFDKVSPARRKTLGRSAVHLFVINTIVPFLFLYGKRKGEAAYKDQALRLLEEVPPEKNQIISKWGALGVKPESAYQTQALLQLKNNYCTLKKCLSCAIGNAILKA